MLMDYENNESPMEALLQEIRTNMAACIQCGTCSASCPNAASMDLTPRQMWRKILLGLEQEVFESHTFWLCSACYSCTLRCPRGLPITKASLPSNAWPPGSEEKRTKNTPRSTNPLSTMSGCTEGSRKAP